MTSRDWNGRLAFEAGFEIWSGNLVGFRWLLKLRPSWKMYVATLALASTSSSLPTHFYGAKLRLNLPTHSQVTPVRASTIVLCACLDTPASRDLEIHAQRPSLRVAQIWGSLAFSSDMWTSKTSYVVYDYPNDDPSSPRCVSSEFGSGPAMAKKCLATKQKHTHAPYWLAWSRCFLIFLGPRHITWETSHTTPSNKCDKKKCIW